MSLLGVDGFVGEVGSRLTVMYMAIAQQFAAGNSGCPLRTVTPGCPPGCKSPPESPVLQAEIPDEVADDLQCVAFLDDSMYTCHARGLDGLPNGTRR